MADKSSQSEPNRRQARHGLNSTAEVSFADFKAATQDPEVKKFLANAKRQGELLKRQGLIRP
ncbi:MAG TPA: hypothetical protein VNR67_08015 [Solirubrobacterales bacterium]|nr:hypothetical protein [Solirubrobacterales bacterium]